MAQRESKILTTTAEVMAVLEGPWKVSELIEDAGMKPPSYKLCWEWPKDDFFPARYFVPMWTALLARGFWADPTLWRQSPLILSQRKRQLLCSVFRSAAA